MCRFCAGMFPLTAIKFTLCALRKDIVVKVRYIYIVEGKNDSLVMSSPAVTKAMVTHQCNG